VKNDVTQRRHATLSLSLRNLASRR